MSKTIITIDDSMSIREIVKLSLAPYGYNVLTAEDGVSGLQLCSSHRVDLVLTDLNMPRLNGIALIAKLRALPAYRFTPIVMLTTESQAAQKMAGKQAGATGWIVKPFDSPKLLQIVQRLCPAA